jgi:hypothetical protein
VAEEMRWDDNINLILHEEGCEDERLGEHTGFG